MRRAIVLAVAVVLVGSVGEAAAEWPHLQARSVPLGPPESPVPPWRSWFVIGPGTGPVAPRPSHPSYNPVVGSVERTGLFAHPHTGRTRYTGLGYDPVLGRFEKYSFRR